MSSLTLQANLFQEFHPIGGVSARFFEALLFSCAARVAHSKKMAAAVIGILPIFMKGFYQKWPEIDMLCKQWPKLSQRPRFSIKSTCVLWGKDLRQHVLPAFNHLLRDLLAQLDGIKWFVFGQAAQDRELSAQHIAIGNGGDNFLRG